MRPFALRALVRRSGWIAFLLMIERPAVGQLSSPDGIVAWGATAMDSRLLDDAFVDIGAGSAHTLARTRNSTPASMILRPTLCMIDGVLDALAHLIQGASSRLTEIFRRAARAVDGAIDRAR